MSIGFIGLGHLGTAIAGRLIDCGHTLTVWNRTTDKAQGLEAAVAISPAALAEQCDIIFLCLFDSDAVREVLSGDNGLLSGAPGATIVVDLTTNHFGAVGGFYDLCRDNGATYLEVPVIGSVVPAQKGALTILVSGEEEAFGTVRPILEEMGEYIFYLGEPGAASKMKVINNMALGSIMAAVTEALAMGEDAGIDREQALEILSVGGGSSRILTAKSQKLLDEDFSTHFSSALLYKDLYCLMDLAWTQKKPLLIAALVKELYGRTFEEGIDQEDFSAIYKLFRKKKQTPPDRPA